LFRGFGVGGIDHLIIDRCQRGCFGDFAGDSVDDPDLLSIQLAALKRLPDGGHVFRHPAAAGEQATHR
jgi:hypothetical protein